MNYDTTVAADYAGKKLDSLLERAARDTEVVIATKSIPEVVTHFAELRATFKALGEKMKKIDSHLDKMSEEIIPTMFMNQRVKNTTVEGVGRVAINHRWTASMLEKEQGLAWLREHNAEGLIIETVNAQTLGAHAKDMAEKKQPLPADVFRINTTPFVSITKV